MKWREKKQMEKEIRDKKSHIFSQYQWMNGNISFISSASSANISSLFLFMNITFIRTVCTLVIVDPMAKERRRGKAIYIFEIKKNEKPERKEM